MAKDYAVILVEDEETCAVKKVSKNTFDQVKDMVGEGENGLDIIESIVELNSTEDNIAANGLTKDEAIDYAEDNADSYVILEIY
jgi:hypothetical protein